jgi:DNA repair exonuclease SbcCD ATPase subunit
MLLAYIDGVEFILRILRKALSKYLRVIRVGPVELELKGATARSYDETFRKISEAKQHLSEAVESLDSLKAQYADENNRLGSLLHDVKQKRSEYETASQELRLTKDLLAKDRDALRKALGIDERRGKIAGFVGGVAASLVATVVWVWLPHLWLFVRSWVLIH